MNHLYLDKHENRGNLATMIAVFQDHNIPPDQWGSILGTDGAFHSLTKKKIPKRMTEVIKQMKKKKQ
jgi:hypothetical protein